MRQFGRWYAKCLKAHPLITKSITGSLLAVGSDLTCQTLEKRMSYHTFVGVFNKSNKPYTFERTVRFGLFNLLVFIPSLHFYMARLLPRILPVKGFPSLLRKLAFDQAVGASAFIVIFYVGMSAFEGKGVQAGAQNCKEKFWTTLKANWILWPAANLLNFGLVPIQYQVLFSNLVAFAWNIYLSYMQNSYQRRS